MNKLAIAYVTCDKYSHVWEEWHDAYMKHWGINIPVYWCGEEQPPIDDYFIQIFHPQVEAEHWTSKLRTQIEQIPEEHIFVWLDDQIPTKNISQEFTELYKWFVENEADALRIMGRRSKAVYRQVGVVEGRPVFKLLPNSHYMVSFSPNIYRKDFLLAILQGDESPWACELNELNKTRYRLKGIYAYHIDGWIINRVIQ